jgi:uncharacterized protein involved in exopolysaccharide biosynthesis
MTETTPNLSVETDDPIKMTDRDRLAASWQAPLLDLLCVLARHRLILVLVPLLGVAIGVVQYLRKPAFYRASSVMILLPREQPTLDVSVLSGTVETTDDGAQRADSGLLMLPPQTDLYVALLHSRPVLERLADRFHDRLMKFSEVKEDDRSDEIVMRLRGMLRTVGTDEGMLTLTVTADEPTLAAEIANALVEEVRQASQAIERQLLVQQVGHLERAVEATDTKLRADEAVLKDFCRQYKVIDPGLQSSDRLRQIRELTASRDEALSRLAERRIRFKDGDPGIRELEARVELKDQRIAELRNRFAGDLDEAEYGRLLIEYEGLRRRIRQRRDLLATLSIQADIFRIRADQPAGNIALLRAAVPIFTPAGPSKKKTFGVAIGGALFLALALALMLDQIRVIHKEPLLNAKLLEFRATLLSRKRLPLQNDDRPALPAGGRSAG